MRKDKLLISLAVIDSGMFKGDYRADYICKSDNSSDFHYFDSVVESKTEVLDFLRHKYNMVCPKKAIHI